MFHDISHKWVNNPLSINKINISFAGKIERIKIKDEIRIDNGNICVTIKDSETNHGFTRIFRRKGSEPV